MRDPLGWASDAALQLGLIAEDAPPVDGNDLLDFARAAELRPLYDAAMRVGADVVRMPPELVRRFELRRALRLGRRGIGELDREFSMVFTCTTFDPPRCRCMEDAVAEVAAAVSRVDDAAVAAARARAEVLHGRFSRRLGRARARTARLLRAGVPVHYSPAESLGRLGDRRDGAIGDPPLDRAAADAREGSHVADRPKDAIGRHGRSTYRGVPLNRLAAPG